MGTEARTTLEGFYRRALDRALEAFGQLSDEDWTDSRRSGQWSAKDYLAHLVASQENEGNPVTEQAIAGRKPAIDDFGGPQDVDAYNARIIETVRGLPPSELIERFRSAFERNLEMLAGLSDEDLAGTVDHPGWFGTGTLAQLFSTAYLHLPLHYQDIRRCLKSRKQLPHWFDGSTPEEVHDVLARTFDYMPVTYWPERGGDLEATFLFDLTGEGGGAWTVEIAGPKCRSYEGRPERASLQITTSPAGWVDLMTKDLNPLWGFVTRRIKLKGNYLLVAKLEKVFEVT